MGKKLSPSQLELYQYIDDLLWKDWDPIGVYAVPEARDEYHGYLPVVFGKAIHGKSVKEIAEYLGQIETDSMGISCNIKGNLIVAEKIFRKAHLLLEGVSNE